MNEAYILLNVDYKEQKNIIEKAKKIQSVKTVKAVYGIYDVLIILESNDMQQITLLDNSGNEKTLDVDGLFIEMGSKINLEFVKHLVTINTRGEIEVTGGGRTTHPAIFAAGDATSIPYKQIISTCGDGAAAGLSAFNHVEKIRGKPGVRADWKKTIGDTVFHY